MAKKAAPVVTLADARARLEEKSLSFPTEEEFKAASARQRLDWARLRAWSAVIFCDDKALVKWRHQIQIAHSEIALEKARAERARAEARGRL